MKREAIKKWIWEHMHESIADTIEALNVKLTGHNMYYRIYGNYVGIQKYYKYVIQELWKSKRPDLLANMEKIHEYPKDTSAGVSKDLSK